MTTRKHLISPSLLSCDFARLGDEVRAVEAAGADWIHVDVMDGRFVPNITIGPLVTAAVKKHASKPLDVHLMIVEPEKHLVAFAEAGADWITVHAEACDHLHNTIRMLKHDEPFAARGVRAGAALNPHTPIGVLDYVLQDLDLIIIMTVNPGWGAQPHIPRTLRKIDELHERFEQLGMTDPPLIEVDGGVKATNADDFAGADVLVSGSGVFGWPGGDYAEAMRQIRSRADGA
jgi:ribulose-phosphate 3-epimerase